ncbi:MAG: LD-carboxypeptidase, partial [Ilumatobacteraceae bacterium]
IGRFQADFGMTWATLEEIVGSKRELARIPIVANVDFGHTDPMLTIPVGGHAVIDAEQDTARLTLASDPE